MSKKLVPCEFCGKEVKDGTGKATHLKQWCKLNPESRRFEGPKVQDPIPEDAADIPGSDVASLDPTTPPEAHPGADPNAGEGNFATSPPPPVQPAPPPVQPAPPPVQPAPAPVQPAPAPVQDPGEGEGFDLKKNGPMIILIVAGIICASVGIYLWVRQSDKSKNSNQNKDVRNPPHDMVESAPGVWEYRPGGGL